MWALFNPGKKGARGKTKKKRRLSEGLKGYQQFQRDYGYLSPAWRKTMWQQKRGEYAAKGAERKRIRGFKAKRAARYRKVPRRFVLRSDIPGIVGNAVRGAVCGGEGAVARAKSRYCKVKPAPAAAAASEPSTRGAAAEWRQAISEYLPWGSAENPRRKGKKRGSNPMRRGGKRKFQFNPGGIVASATAGYRPSAIAEALPFAAGVVGSTLLSNLIFARLPAVAKKNAVKYAIGIGIAGVLSTVIKFVKPSMARGVLYGGVGGTLALAIEDIRTKGFGAMLAGDDFDYEGLPGWQGMGDVGDFITPGMTQAAQQMPPQIAQYPLPSPTQIAPDERAQYEQTVLSEMISDASASVI